MSRTPIATALFLILSVILSPAIRAQEQSMANLDSTLAQRVGVLSGHAFIPSAFIQDPFIRTYLKSDLGFGSTINRVAPLVVVQGDTLGGSKGDFMFALFSVEYQQTIRPWLAIRGRLDVIGRLANGTTTLIAQGVTLYSGFELGWLFQAVKSERFFLSGSLGMRNASATDVYLQRFVDGIVQDGTILPGNRLVESTPTLRGTGGVRGAYTLSRLTGVTVSGNLDYGESLNRSDPDRWYYGLAVAFDFNLRSNDGPPLGFVVGGSTGSAPDAAEGDSRTAQIVFGRIAYTGAEQFALGLDLAYNYLPIRNVPDKQNFISAVVDIRLFF